VKKYTRTGADCVWIDIDRFCYVRKRENIDLSKSPLGLAFAKC